MRNCTPRATPLVARPPTARHKTLAAEPRAVFGPIVLVCAGAEHQLRTGSALLGRHADCEIVVDDPLVSRMHARIKINAGGVFIEDLHSTNGVYLNGMRISHEARLHVGDGMLVGTHELAVFECRSEAAPASSRVLADGDQPRLDELDLSLEPVRSPAVSARMASLSPIPPTAKVDALDIVGRLARRLAQEGKADEALRVLAPHLRSILRGANAGLLVSDHVCALASGYAMDLAHWTVEVVWLDYVVELHLACRRLMSRAVLLSLQRSERWLGEMNRALLAYYAESFVAQSSALDSDERTRLAMIEKLAES
jgi:pSer/pThr/pTyr-binding forkhead associated (FHA) protein